MMEAREEQKARGEKIKATARLRMEKDEKFRKFREEVFGAGSLFVLDGPPIPSAPDAARLKEFSDLRTVEDSEAWAQRVSGGYPSLNRLWVSKKTTYVTSVLCLRGCPCMRGIAMLHQLRRGARNCVRLVPCGRHVMLCSRLFAGVALIVCRWLFIASWLVSSSGSMCRWTLGVLWITCSLKCVA